MNIRRTGRAFADEAPPRAREAFGPRTDGQAALHRRQKPLPENIRERLLRVLLRNFPTDGEAVTVNVFARLAGVVGGTIPDPGKGPPVRPSLLRRRYFFFLGVEGGVALGFGLGSASGASATCSVAATTLGGGVSECTSLGAT